MQKKVALLILLAMLLAVSLVPFARADGDTPPDVETGIAGIDRYGNISLTVTPESMAELGYEVTDIIRVKIGDAEMLMPIGTAYNDADSGEFICCFRTNSSGVREVTLAIDLGDLASTIGIERRAVEAEPGYEWDYDKHTTVAISMAQKQGYAEEYALHQSIGSRTNKREDYPNLSDAEFANFRVVEMGDLGKGTLYRSSSPVNPVIKRNREADAALGQALVRTVMNMSDNDVTMRKYEGFSQTHCAGCDIIPLDMSIDFMLESNRQKLAEDFGKADP